MFSVMWVGRISLLIACTRTGSFSWCSLDSERRSLPLYPPTGCHDNSDLRADTALNWPSQIKEPLDSASPPFESVILKKRPVIDEGALAIAHLADRLRGGASFATPWPTDDLGLSRAERRELQRLLLSRGHDVGTPSGVMTPGTIAAVRSSNSVWDMRSQAGQASDC